ncbi:hypothetical protein RBSWK_05494 [Rhodopirellula baltica SWK14]|uniref:Uncharacterized protein n=1 Tax=Rhodopirellula baltica SWK14 TaxID=993516 RepID=L7CA70_RHOBT|nr:hypothetical protein RBSWK_05494 [Rhodopirellula baltica SWK14]
MIALLISPINTTLSASVKSISSKVKPVREITTDFPQADDLIERRLLD